VHEEQSWQIEQVVVLGGGHVKPVSPQRSGNPAHFARQQGHFERGRGSIGPVIGLKFEREFDSESGRNLHIAKNDVLRARTGDLQHSTFAWVGCAAGDPADGRLIDVGPFRPAVPVWQRRCCGFDRRLQHFRECRRIAFCRKVEEEHHRADARGVVMQGVEVDAVRVKPVQDRLNLGFEQGELTYVTQPTTVDRNLEDEQQSARVATRTPMLLFTRTSRAKRVRPQLVGVASATASAPRTSVCASPGGAARSARRNDLKVQHGEKNNLQPPVI